jgi:hypothetical protein
MFRITDLEVPTSAAKRAGLSRREFLERAAQAGIVAGVAGLNLRSAFAQGSPPPPGKPNLLSAATGFVPASGFSLAGNIADGSALTVSKAGGGFGTKPNGAKPLYWWPLDADANPSSLSRNTTNPTATINGALSTALLPSGSTGTWQKDLAADESALFLRVPFTSDTLYFWTKRYYDFDFDALLAQHITQDNEENYGFNLKTFRFWHEWTHDVYHGYNGAESWNSNNPPADGNPRTGAENTMDYSRWNGHGFVPRTWLVEEVEYRTSSLNTTDGVLNYIRQGRHEFDRATTRWQFRTTAYPGTYSSLYLDQKSNGSLSSLHPAYEYLDAYYVDDSWCRVMISDESSWQVTTQPSGNSCNREIQVPTAWSDSSINFALRQGSHASLRGKYLYVILQDGTAVKAGAFA